MSKVHYHFLGMENLYDVSKSIDHHIFSADKNTFYLCTTSADEMLPCHPLLARHSLVVHISPTLPCIRRYENAAAAIVAAPLSTLIRRTKIMHHEAGYLSSLSSTAG